MELIDALRTTGSIRQFTDEPVSDKELYEILDNSRFAPSGGNRQAWRVIVVRDPKLRRAIGDLYLDAWHDYVGHVLAGLVAFSPLASEHDRSSAAALRGEAITKSQPDGFAETIADVPAMLVICADLAALAATDRDLDRYQFAGGASVYPFAWNLLLSAREIGLGGVITTVALRKEPAVKELLEIPDTFALAAVVVLGHPQQRHTKLTRRAVGEFATIDTFSGGPLRQQ
jgi:nitroreductase